MSNKKQQSMTMATNPDENGNDGNKFRINSNQDAIAID